MGIYQNYWRAWITNHTIKFIIGTMCMHRCGQMTLFYSTNVCALRLQMACQFFKKNYWTICNHIKRLLSFKIEKLSDPNSNGYLLVLAFVLQSVMVVWHMQRRKETMLLLLKCEFIVNIFHQMIFIHVQSFYIIN